MNLSHIETKARRRLSSGLFLFLVLVFCLSGCSTYQIDDVMMSFPAVKVLVSKNLPQGLRRESLNGRHMYSGYFTPGNYYEDATDLKERAYAEVVINGSSRPYRIDVFVYREQRESRVGRYTKAKKDKKLAEELGAKIRAALADRREERNIIDDFRAF